MTIEETLNYLRTLGFVDSPSTPELIEKKIGPITLRANPEWMRGRVQINGSFRSRDAIANTEGALTDSVFQMLAHPVGMLPPNPSIADVHERLEAVLDELPEPAILRRLGFAIGDSNFEELNRIRAGEPIPPTLKLKPGRCSLLHKARTPEMVQWLVDLGVDPNQCDLDGRTPLHTASDPALIAALVAAGASVHIVDRKGKTALHRTLSADAIRVLLAAGADPDASDREGNTPLHFQYAKAAVLALLEGGADANTENDKGETPLARSLLHDDVVLTTVLLMNKADPNRRNHRGRTAVFAVRSPKMLELIADVFGADVTIKDHAGRTALFEAEDPMLVSALRRRGLSASDYDADGITPLHLVSSIDGVRELVQAGAHVNAQDQSGRTPLHHAASKARQHVVRGLLDAGADTHIVDSAGKRPADVAATDHIRQLMQQQ